MGDPRFPRKHYDTPSHPWQKERIESENALVHQYGLKNKREIWRATTRVREMRHQARSLTANAASEQARKEHELLLARLGRLGMLEQGAGLEDVLRLGVEKLLDRRLQTQVYLQGLAGTPRQARQLITHGHIAVDGTVSRVPGMLVSRLQEKQIAYGSGSPLTNDLHPVRPQPRSEADFDSEPARDDSAAPAADDKPPKEKAGTDGEAESAPEEPAAEAGTAEAGEPAAGKTKEDAAAADANMAKDESPAADAEEAPAADEAAGSEDDSGASEDKA